MWKYKSIDNDVYFRGWSISVWTEDVDRNISYLYKDGGVREGVQEPISSAFWSSEKEAITFYNNWSNT